MSNQDSKSELDEILNKVYVDGEYYATHSENVILDGHTRRSIKNAKEAIEAYVTTRVKEELQELVHGRETYVSSGLIKQRIEALTTTTNGKDN